MDRAETLEDDSMDEIKSLFETNLFGAIRVMKAVLPIMRERGQRGNNSKRSQWVAELGFHLALPITVPNLLLKGYLNLCGTKQSPLELKSCS